MSDTFISHIQALIKTTDLSERRFSVNLSFSTQSDSAINFLLEKYNDCRTNHAQCKLPGRLTSSGYPSRLLDVGTKVHDPIVLRSSVMYHIEDYVCLSYCWGDTRPFTLNADAYSVLVSGIQAAILPKIFQDAISVTRRLGIQYLWIDSLYVTTYSCQFLRTHLLICILQDNKDDWASESGRMGLIYAQSTCTIAATASKTAMVACSSKGVHSYLNHGLYISTSIRNLLGRKGETIDSL